MRRSTRAAAPGKEHIREWTATQPSPIASRLARATLAGALLAAGCGGADAPAAEPEPRLGATWRVLDAGEMPPPEGLAPPSAAAGPLLAPLPDATPRDLAALADALGVPVHGILRAQLRDSYDEARGSRVHEAIDILAPTGTPVLAAADGRLLKLFDSEPGGLMVYATDATERFILLYGHLDRYADGMREGMQLTRGEVIGYVGTTGNASAGTPHLHFAVLRADPALSWWKGTPVNPFPLLAR